MKCCDTHAHTHTFPVYKKNEKYFIAKQATVIFHLSWRNHAENDVISQTTTVSSVAWFCHSLALLSFTRQNEMKKRWELFSLFMVFFGIFFFPCSSLSFYLFFLFAHFVGAISCWQSLYYSKYLQYFMLNLFWIMLILEVLSSFFFALFLPFRTWAIVSGMTSR